MYAQIVIECQTQKNLICCEYCIAKEACQLHLDGKNKLKVEKEPNLLFAVGPETLTRQKVDFK
jgi:hypothetical protein